MYLFIDENQIIPYSGEILKRLINDRLVKVIANPTDEDLKDFGYKELDDTAEIPEEKEGFSIETYYIDGENITKAYRYAEIPESELTEE